MRGNFDTSISLWIARHALLVWLGIFLNILFIVPLFLWPRWMLDLFNIPLDQLIWARCAAGLLAIISTFYVPATIDFGRYRVFAYLSIFPSRTFGATFFFLAVTIFGQPAGFLSISLVDALIGSTTLYCLIRIAALERAQRRHEATR
ncbi:MAG: hypothetical protein AB7O80_22725 [Acetobacteraceae bacterium]